MTVDKDGTGTASAFAVAAVAHRENPFAAQDVFEVFARFSM